MVICCVIPYMLVGVSDVRQSINKYANYSISLRISHCVNTNLHACLPFLGEKKSFWNKTRRTGLTHIQDASEHEFSVVLVKKKKKKLS